MGAPHGEHRKAALPRGAWVRTKPRCYFRVTLLSPSCYLWALTGVHMCVLCLQWTPEAQKQIGQLSPPPPSSCDSLRRSRKHGRSEEKGHGPKERPTAGCFLHPFDQDSQGCGPITWRDPLSVGLPLESCQPMTETCSVTSLRNWEILPCPIPSREPWDQEENRPARGKTCPSHKESLVSAC